MGWHLRFRDAIDVHIARGAPIDYAIVDLDGSDWIEVAEPFDIVLWKPAVMGPQAATHFKEKIYFLQHHMGKVTVPNYETIWHFESKIAQSYLFRLARVPTARTTVSFDYYDARRSLDAQALPLVFKESFGAASVNVRLVRDRAKAQRLLVDRFASQFADEARARKGTPLRAALSGLLSRWLWAKLAHKTRGAEHFRAVYWQEFLPGNDADLRVTAVGDKYAVAFWRLNRPNDFRASGSGRIDYSRPVPIEVIERCLELNRQFGFDSMAYDLVRSGDEYVVLEMSYAYLDSAVYNAGRHYRRGADGSLELVETPIWPQQLWVDWLLERWARESAHDGNDGAGVLETATVVRP
jgi:glutathione synthase/RimK-type ligase-like ATP-grasp enzyme